LFSILTVLTGRRISREDGKAARTEKPKALTADVGLIRVVVRREAPSNHADGYPPPCSVGAKRPHYK